MKGMKDIKMQRTTRLSFFSRREMAELPRLLLPGESVIAVLSGFYTAGTALLCVTNRRLLLIDKKFVRLSYEDVRFEAISDISYSQQAMLASARFYIAGRNIQFRSWYKKELRILVQFVQDRMFEAHQQVVVNSQQSYNHHFMNRRRKVDSPTQLSGALSSAKNDEDNGLDSFGKDDQHAPQHIPRHIVDRVNRLQRAARFVGELPSA